MPDPAYKHIKATMVDDVLVVEINTTDVQGPAMVQELGAELSQVVAEFRARKVLLDFTGVNYLGSIAFAALSKTVKNVRGGGGQIKFCNMQSSVRGAADIIFGSEVYGSRARRRDARQPGKGRDKLCNVVIGWSKLTFTIVLAAEIYRWTGRFAQRAANETAIIERPAHVSANTSCKLKPRSPCRLLERVCLRRGRCPS